MKFFKSNKEKHLEMVQKEYKNLFVDIWQAFIYILCKFDDKKIKLTFKEIEKLKTKLLLLNLVICYKGFFKTKYITYSEFCNVFLNSRVDARHTTWSIKMVLAEHTSFVDEHYREVIDLFNEFLLYVYVYTINPRYFNTSILNTLMIFENWFYYRYKLEYFKSNLIENEIFLKHGELYNKDYVTEIKKLREYVK